jgi:PleD family two-component response regulator
MSTTTFSATAPSLVASRNPVLCIVDDDDLYRQYLAALLKANSCRVLEASRGLDLIDILDTNQVDCILLDYNLITENGLSVHQQIKERFRDVPPIVMLTNETNERTIIKAFRGGVTDFVLKQNLRSDELFRAIANALSRRDSERSEQEELARLRQKSDFDDATALHTREYMERQLARVAEARRRGRFAVILICPTGLDEIGVKFGQVVHDRSFRAFAARLRAIVRASDMCGRYDHLKFIYLVDVDVRQKSIGAICARLAKELPLEMNLDGLKLIVAPAIAAAIYPFDGDTVQAVLASAERALEECRTSAMSFVVASGASSAGEEPGADHVEDGRAASAAAYVEADLAPSAAGTSERQSDRRAVHRQRVFKRAKIFIPSMPSAIDCTMRDVSAKGARLIVGAPLMVPEKFDVIFGNTTERKPVVLRWQIGNQIGVQFVSTDLQRDR